METYLTAKDVAEKVRLSEQTIRRYTMLKQIPFHKIGRVVRYKECEIEKWVESREKQDISLGADFFVEGGEVTSAGGVHDRL